MFINEYITPEDVIKYNLKDAVHRYHPSAAYHMDGEPLTLMWTIDKDENIFLIPMRGGREEFSNRLRWMFFHKGKEFKVEADSVGSPTQKLSDPVFHRKWEIIEISPVLPAENIDQKACDSLVEAFVSYGYGGARKQLPNTKVTVNINCK